MNQRDLTWARYSYSLTSFSRLPLFQTPKQVVPRAPIIDSFWLKRELRSRDEMRPQILCQNRSFCHGASLLRRLGRQPKWRFLCHFWGRLYTIRRTIGHPSIRISLCRASCYTSTLHYKLRHLPSGKSHYHFSNCSHRVPCTSCRQPSALHPDRGSDPLSIDLHRWCRQHNYTFRSR